MATEHTQSSATRRLVEMYERERSQLVHELQHDLAQRLTALKCHAEVVRRHCGPEGAARVAQIGALTDEVVSYVRSLSLRLRPPVLDDLGLKPTLIWYVNQVEALTGKPVVLRLGGLDVTLDYLAETAIFRILQGVLGVWTEDAATARMVVEVAAEDAGVRLSFERERAHSADALPGSTADLQPLIDEASSWTSWLGGAVNVGSEGPAVDRLAMTIPLGSTPGEGAR